MCLHLVCRSSGPSNALAHCLAVYAPGDALLLLGDAVYSLLDTTLNLPQPVLALGNDWELRLKGLQPPKNAKLIDYVTWLDLAIAHPQSVTWA